MVGHYRNKRILLSLFFFLDKDTGNDSASTSLHAEIQVCMSVRSAMRVVTDRQMHTHRQTHDVKTITPITSETWGVKIEVKY